MSLCDTPKYKTRETGWKREQRRGKVTNQSRRLELNPKWTNETTEVCHIFYIDSGYVQKKSTVDPEWPKRLSMKNEKFLIQEFKNPSNCSFRSPYIKYDF